MTVIKAGSAHQDTGGAHSALGPYAAALISDTAGLTQFGAFIEELPPGSKSSHAHWHSAEDEMVLILAGTITLIEDGVETQLSVGDAACWRAGDPTAHTMHNRTTHPVRYVVIGTRAKTDIVTYPNHDRILHHNRATGARTYTTLDGAPAPALE